MIEKVRKIEMKMNIWSQRGRPHRHTIKKFRRLDPSATSHLGRLEVVTRRFLVAVKVN